jgi:hypothetical protein
MNRPIHGQQGVLRTKQRAVSLDTPVSLEIGSSNSQIRYAPKPLGLKSAELYSTIPTSTAINVGAFGCR